MMTENAGELWPAWVEAVATTGAFVAAGIAAFYGWRAFSHERTLSRLERGRGVAAWWVHTGDDPTSGWGVVLANDSRDIRMDVRVAVHGNSRAGGRTLDIRILPPGRFFIESRGTGEPGEAWGLPRSVGSLEAYEPLMQAARKRVDEIAYSDAALATRWSWTPQRGLRELRHLDASRPRAEQPTAE